MTQATHESQPQQFASIRAAARHCGLSHDSIERFVRRKLLRAFRPGGIGKRLVDLTELDQLVRRSEVTA
jgi:hypothetical protein